MKTKAKVLEKKFDTGEDITRHLELVLPKQLLIELA